MKKQKFLIGERVRFVNWCGLDRQGTVIKYLPKFNEYTVNFDDNSVITLSEKVLERI